MTAPASCASDALMSHLKRTLKPRKHAAPATVYAARSGIAAWLISDTVVFVRTPDLANPISQLQNMPLDEQTYKLWDIGAAQEHLAHWPDLHSAWGTYEATNATPLTLTRELIEGDGTDWRVLKSSLDGSPVYLDRSFLSIFGRDWSVISQFAYEKLDGKDGAVRVSGGHHRLTTLGYIMPARHVSLAGEISKQMRGGG